MTVSVWPKALTVAKRMCTANHISNLPKHDSDTEHADVGILLFLWSRLNYLRLRLTHDVTTILIIFNKVILFFTHNDVSISKTFILLTFAFTFLVHLPYFSEFVVQFFPYWLMQKSNLILRIYQPCYSRNFANFLNIFSSWKTSTVIFICV